MIAKPSEIRVFRKICEIGPISRAHLARILNSSRATLTQIANALLTSGYVIEVGKGASTDRGGRREILLSVNPNAGYILALQLDRDFAKVGLFALNLQLLEARTLNYTPGTDLEEVLLEAQHALERLILKFDIPVEKIIGLGVGVPGVPSEKNRRLRETEHKSWQGFPIAEFLENAFNKPVALDNDVKALTLGEFKYGAGKGARDLICLWAGNGIGAGVVANGKLLRGATSSAGEIGYNELNLGFLDVRSLLINGHPRDWGDVLSQANVLAAMKRGVREGWKTDLSETSDISEFAKAAEAGDPLGLHLLKLYGSLLGSVCTNMLYAFNPPLLVLHGPLFYDTTLLPEEVRRCILDGILRAPVEAVEIRTGSFGSNAMLLGCASLVIDSVYPE